MDNVLVCRRENNVKRNYVLVNKYQGKHYPIEETHIIKEVDKLFNGLCNSYKEVMNGNNKIVIGFAETATGIGALFGKHFMSRYNSWYTTTTREDIPNKEYVDFSEEHSHATEQRLYIEDLKEAYQDKYDLFFVEDEITTGNTIRNMLKKLNSTDILKNCNVIYINSLLNGMSDEDAVKMEALGKELGLDIKTNYNQKIDSKASFTKKAEDIEIVKRNFYNFDMGDNLRMRNSYSAFSYDEDLGFDIRTGMKIKDYCYHLRRVLSKAASDIKDKNLVSNESKIRVIGTEECMYPAIELSNLLRGILSNPDIKTHSTTRSPIEAGHSIDTSLEYGLTSRYVCHSLYEDNRWTYLYNSLDDDRDSDLVIIVTDSKRSKVQSLGLVDLVTFYKEYCNAKNAYIVRI